MMGLTGHQGGLQMDAMLHFCSDRMGAPQLWVWDKSEDKQWRISDRPISPIYEVEVPQWSSDGKYLITKLRPEDIDLSTIIFTQFRGTNHKRMAN